MRAGLPSPPEPPGSTQMQEPLNPCDRINCRYCPNLDKSGKIQSSYTKREYVTKFNVTCKSNNLIYCITCKKCGTQYVGQTKRRLMDRFQRHYYLTTRNDKYNDIATHFNTPEHTGINDMRIYILDFIHLHPESTEGAAIRDQIEMNWIHRLHTQQPLGLNILDKPPPANPRVCRNWTTYRGN